MHTPLLHLLCNVKGNMIHQTRPPSNALWSSFDPHVPTVGAFDSGRGCLPGQQLCKKL